MALSRSACSARFIDLVGQLPLTYLARWCMVWATRLLKSNVGVATIAGSFGYGSDAAFRKAFKREIGMSPATWLLVWPLAQNLLYIFQHSPAMLNSLSTILSPPIYYRKPQKGIAMSQQFEQGYALVVGVGHDLPTTVDDAIALADLLRDATRCAYPPEQVRLLTAVAAHRQAVLDELDWLANAAGSEDTVVVYFSGHGIETPNYYLAPYGYDLSNVDETMIPASLFNEKLRAIHSQKLVVILDCCYAGGQAEAKGVTKAPLPPDVLQTLGSSSGRVVIASSRKDETSLPGEPYSLFTTALLEALAGYGTFEQDGYARVLDVTMWVGRQVPARSGEHQHPIIKVSKLEDNFALAWYAAGEKQIKPLPWQTPTASVVATADTAQRASWKKQLANYRQNLIMIEDRMSEYIEFTDIPLQLVKNKQQTETRIADLAAKLGIESK